MKVREATEESFNDLMGHLLRRYESMNSECKNKEGWCLIMGKKHYELDNDHLQVWNDAIGVGKATVYCPPLDLYDMLERTVPSSPPLPPPPHQQPLQLLPILRENQSNPIGSNNIGPSKQLRTYINWFHNQEPESAGALKYAYTQLSYELYSVELIREATTDDWKTLDIPIGLGKRLQKMVRTWKINQR